ncbi:Rhamnolipids biosynthesis 3-oxoacyl-[acyl-carrier-protein] reductase [Aquisphaera giovannonii]|uniref:Rhamnolipids biosynthesis 3-oxoacyl-[acyl-carrier-protein] reductase n=1 Tax=Aquisphaera giovannonii TaxID=406548 RepID=A0A5B9VZQ6_9BACT|nr:SDR family oxidoreductase [Aquisphaera giovannonii]QEH33434.1 Rhamnolipids biosynthesis 3-oxoacyl-[acyl-carrier-protein] reductase [Aquisphaera giovannonii]
MSGKVCVVTGASTGIGYVTARELVRDGARVIGVGRSPERCESAARRIREETGSGAIDFLIADLSSQAEIRRLVPEILAKAPRLDVLVNNAGGIFLSRETTADGLEMTFALNHLAYFLLTNLLIDHLKGSAPARIVCVASAAHQGVTLPFDNLNGEKSFSPWRAYQRSKLANILFVRELARRLEGTGVTVNALHPGYVRTEIFRARGPAGWLMRRFADAFAITPERGAETSVYLAASPEVEGVSGQYFYRKKPIAPSRAALDDEAAKRLWQVSEELTASSGSASGSGMA